MSREELAALARRWMDEVWRQRRLDAIDELHAEDFVDRSPAGRPADREAYKTGVAELFAAFPDWEAETDDLVVDVSTGSVAIRWTAHGTQRGPFLGVPPAARPIVFRGIEILRVEDGRIVERWGEWDGIDLLRQLAVIE